MVHFAPNLDVGSAGARAHGPRVSASAPPPNKNHQSTDDVLGMSSEQAYSAIQAGKKRNITWSSSLRETNLGTASTPNGSRRNLACSASASRTSCTYKGMLCVRVCCGRGREGRGGE